MKTIQLSERELSMIFSMMTPPYHVRDAHTDEFNELRNKVFYALRDAQNDEHVSNRDELPLDYLQGHKDGLEWAAQLAEANHPQTGDWLYDDPTELAKAIRKGPDMPFSDGNSPVIPDGWIKCTDRMPDEDGNYWGWWSESKRQGPVWFIKSDLQAQFQSSEITHWMPLPAAPQQEARKSNVIGSYQGADGQEHPIVSLSSPQQEVK